MRDAWFAAVVIGLGFAMVMSIVGQLLFLSLQFTVPEYDEPAYEERTMEIVIPKEA